MNLLLVRGLIRDQRCWGDFPAKLAHHAPQLKLHFIDLPGVGSENLRNSPASIPGIRIDLAKRFHERIAQGKLPPGPWSILGVSMGGMIGLDWVDAEPNLFERLILINSSTSDVATPLERFNIRVLPQLLGTLVQVKPELSERLILEVSSNRFKNHDPKIQAILEQQIKWRRERPVTRATFFRQILASIKYRLPTDRPKAKTVVFSSEGDRLVSPACSVRLAEQLAVTRITHPWAGHDLPLDDPEWLAYKVTEWMKGAL